MTQLQITQQGDVSLYQTDGDGGDIDVTDGVVSMTSGTEVAAYLSMFGGDDWWGNTIEDDPKRKYTATTEKTLEGIPATSGNLIRIEDAVNSDIQWMLNSGVAETINVNVSIIGHNRVSIRIMIDGLPFEFAQDWIKK